MAVVWTRESPRGLTISRDKGGGKATRSFLVRVDANTTAVTDIVDAPGIAVGDTHPSAWNLLVKSITASASEDAGMLWAVSVDYEPRQNQNNDNNNEEDDQPGNLPGGPYAHWSASSGVSSVPVWRDINGEVMTNSAGDPLEGLEAEQAEFSLTYTEYYLTHADVPPAVGWLSRALDYVNTVNDAPWNGGMPGQWKCQGCSAKVNTDNNGANGAVRYYWEVTWEFKFSKTYWRLTPWDIGFNELVDENGDPAPTPGISSGADSGGV